jgi:hypothetical protein
MTGILDHLVEFNRKERFLLIGMALGNPEFRLSQSFRDTVQDSLGLRIPAEAFVGMDYHLDWLYASVYLHEHGGEELPHPNLDKIIRAQQEDIDLLIAYQDGAVCRIVLLEAKGAAGFTNKQMRSKALRLREIFGERGDVFPGVSPHFAIVSPREPQRLATTDWSPWMMPSGRIPWIRMTIPTSLKRITQCTEVGKPSRGGGFWRVKRIGVSDRVTSTGSRDKYLPADGLQMS